MPTPENIVFIRHGESEPNLLHKTNHGGTQLAEALQAEILARPDWQQKLTPRGIRQSLLAGEAIRLLYGGGHYFDTKYVSPFIRTRETAGLLFQHQPGFEEFLWETHTDLTERNWGIDSQLTEGERRERSPDLLHSLESSPWFARYNNGESALDVIGRTQHFMRHVEQCEKVHNVLAVTHEGPMSALRYIVEGMLPEEWEALVYDRQMAIRNGTLLHYSRINPDDERDVRQEFSWRKMVYVDKPLEESPDEGHWIEFETRRKHFGAELLKQANTRLRILD